MHSVQQSVAEDTLQWNCSQDLTQSRKSLAAVDKIETVMDEETCPLPHDRFYLLHLSHVIFRAHSEKEWTMTGPISHFIHYCHLVESLQYCEFMIIARSTE